MWKSKKIINRVKFNGPKPFFLYFRMWVCPELQMFTQKGSFLWEASHYLHKELKKGNETFSPFDSCSHQNEKKEGDWEKIGGGWHWHTSYPRRIHIIIIRSHPYYFSSSLLDLKEKKWWHFFLKAKKQISL